MKVGLTGTGVVGLVGVAVVGFLAYRAYRNATAAADGVAAAWDGASQWVEGAVKGVSQAAEQALAGAQQAWGNATGTFVPGDPTRAALYSDAGYAGIDPFTGQPVTLGEWYSNPEALQYEYAQRDAGNAPAATSINGAAFGIYPKAKRTPAGTAQIPQDPWEKIINRKAYAY